MTDKRTLKAMADQPTAAQEAVYVAFLAGRRVTTPRPLTDAGNARRLRDRFGHVLRYVPEHKRWYFWDGKRWGQDTAEGAAVTFLALDAIREGKDVEPGLMRDWIISGAKNPAEVTKDLVEYADKEATAVAKWLGRSESRSRLDAMIGLAARDPQMIVHADDLDADPWLLNVANGTIDLREGTIREHSPADCITKLADLAYNPDAECPRFAAHLERVLKDEATREAFRIFAGYGILGRRAINEQVMALHIGFGANGKSVAQEVLAAALGEYAAQIDAGTILDRSQDRHPEDLARLQGARMVRSTEPEKGARLQESLVKQITGGEKIVARVMRGHSFEYDPDFTLWVASNHEPGLRGGGDESVIRRLLVFPWPERIARHEQVKNLASLIIEDEGPGVLAWLVRASQDYLANTRDLGDGKELGAGLVESPQMHARKEIYRSSQDHVGSFIAECLTADPDAEQPFSRVYQVAQQWWKDSGMVRSTPTKAALGRWLEERGIRGGKSTSGAAVRYVRFTPEGHNLLLKVEAGSF